MGPIRSILRVSAMAAAFAAYLAFAARVPLEFHTEPHGIASCAGGCSDSSPERPETPGSHSPEHCPICVAILATAHALELDPPVRLVMCSDAGPASQPTVVPLRGAARPIQTNPRGPPSA